MPTLANLRKRYEHERLTGLHAKLWSWMGVAIGSTMMLWMVFVLADAFQARVLRGIFMALGLVAVSVVFVLGICLFAISALDAALHTRSRGPRRAWSVGVQSAPLLGAIFVVGWAIYILVRAVMSRL